MRLIYSFIFFLIPIISFSQNCTGDSVVVTHEFESHWHTSSIKTDSFNVLLGTVKKQSIYYYDDVSSVTSYTTNFTRNYIERNMLHDTICLYSFNGTGTGYNNRVKILFTYDPTFNLITSREEYLGSDSIWINFKNEHWIYDSDGALIEYTLLSDSAGNGILTNKNKTIYNYFGSHLDNIIFQTGQTSSWLNSHRYEIYYDNSGIRDSLALHRWDQSISNWSDSAIYHYDPLNNYHVQIAYGNPDTANYDSICFELDTFNLVKKYFYNLNNIMDTGLIHFDHIRGREIMTYYNTVESSNCWREGSISTDSNGVKIEQTGTNRCFIPTSFYNYLVYDSLYRPISTYNYSDPNGNITNEYTDFHFEDPDSIHVRYATMSELYSCFATGTSLLAGAIVSGGCGNYRYQWSPSTGLSSDTVKNPMILVNDTITYTITVSDSLGHTATTSYLSTPLLVITLTTDTLPCAGCIELNVQYTSYVGNGWDIHWYRNGSSISGANQTSYSPTLPGTYTAGFIDSDRHCILYSESYLHNTVNITSPELLSFTAYPNPANDFITLKGLNEKAMIRIFDIAGKEVTSKIKTSSTENETVIYTSLLNPSLYFIDVESSGTHSRLKLIIAR